MCLWFSETEFIVLGGNDGTGSIATMEKYDVDGKLVEKLPSMTKARYVLNLNTVHKHSTWKWVMNYVESLLWIINEFVWMVYGLNDKW